MITLYYIRGITRLDEPVFDKVENQDIFFDAYKIADVETGFYPPHFVNSIVLSTEDITFNKNCNYLSLVYNGKTYYYYIDTIEYVSEDTIKLNVSLDTIQTYMFDIQFNECITTKESILRWSKIGTNYKINRDYIRENLSHEDFMVETYNKSNDDIGWYIVWTRDGSGINIAAGDAPLTPNNGVGIRVPDSTIAGSIYHMNKTPIFIPMLLTEKYEYVDIEGLGTAADTLDYLLDVAGVLGVTFVPFDLFKGIYKSSVVNNRLNLDFTSTTLYDQALYVKRKDDVYQGIGNSVLCELGMTIPLYQSTSSLDVSTIMPYMSVSPNHSKTAQFSVIYVPAIVDENYMQIEYGEQQSCATYPLHELTSPTLYGHMVYDIVSNTRMYYINSNSDNYANRVMSDPYNTMTVVNSIEQVDLYTDAWNEYYSRNSGTWTIGYALNKHKIGYQAVTSSISNMGNTVANVAGSHSLGGAIGSALKGVVDQGITVANTFENQYVLDEERKITKQNLDATPDTEKQGNTYTADLLDGACTRITRCKRVRDIVNVARAYERNGYNVYHHLFSRNLFNLNYRYYYDIIQADLRNINLINVISDESIVMNIKNRFKNGLRLWHTDVGVLRAKYITSFTYDNVETSFIEEDN